MASKFIIIYLVIKVCLVGCQFAFKPQSPCPDNFQYRTDGNAVFGYLTFRLSQPATMVHTSVNFTIASQLVGNYVGRLEPIGSKLDILQEANQGHPINYRVHFPVSSPLPRLTLLQVNGNVVCYGPGDIANPGSYVTTISLHHTLYLKSGTLNVNTDYFSHRQPESKPNIYNRPFNNNFEDPYSNVDNIFTSNRDSGWNEILPFLTNNSKPDIPNVQIFETKPLPQRPPSPPMQTETPQWQLHPQTTQPPLPPEQKPIQCGTISGANEVIPLIHHGQSYPRGDWPWVAAVYSKREGGLNFRCGATLISERHVLSAAHCVQLKGKRTPTRDLILRVGVYDPDDWGDDVAITRSLLSVHIHEAYNDKTLSNDITIFTLEKSVEFNNNVRPACLWEGNTDLNRIVGTTGVVTGWGQTETGPSGHGTPRMVRMPIRSTADCRASKPDFHMLTSSTTLCAGDRNGAGPCNGDSGGGLFVLDGGRWRVRGIVSVSLRPDNGDSTCNLNEYIVFTDAAKFIPWIKNVLAK